MYTTLMSKKDSIFSLNFTKQELTILYNLLVWQDPKTGTPKSYPLSVSRYLLDILNKIEPFVVVESNIPQQEVKVK